MPRRKSAPAPSSNGSATMVQLTPGLCRSLIAYYKSLATEAQANRDWPKFGRNMAEVDLWTGRLNTITSPQQLPLEVKS